MYVVARFVFNCSVTIFNKINIVYLSLLITQLLDNIPDGIRPQVLHNDLGHFKALGLIKIMRKL